MSLLRLIHICFRVLTWIYHGCWLLISLLQNIWFLQVHCIYILGPLAFLFTGITTGIGKLYLYLFQAFVAVCILFILNYFLISLKSLKRQIVFLIVILITGVFVYSVFSNTIVFYFRLFPVSPYF